MSPRSLKRWLSAKHGILLIAENGEQVCGYGLVWCHKGTRLARLYSLAVKPTMQGKGIAKMLLAALEKQTSERGRIYLRLEVAVNNKSAIGLYKSLGYRVLGFIKVWVTEYLANTAIITMIIVMHCECKKIFAKRMS